MMITSRLSWRIKSLSRGLDPEAVLAALEQIEAARGGLTAKNVLEVAEDSGSILHGLFTWDDEEAARQHRLNEARVLINNIQITVIEDEQERTIPVYEIVRVPSGDRMYKNVASFGRHETEQVRLQTIRAIDSLKKKLSLYNDFSGAIQKLGDVVTELSAAS